MSRTFINACVFISVRGGNFPHITQIAAVNTVCGTTFNQFVFPQEPITPEAQQVTGIVFDGQKMTVHGESVEAVPIKEALETFCDWLGRFSNVVLVAHNGRRFDYPVIVNTFAKNDKIEDFCRCVSGCIDSLPVLKKQFPGRSSYKQVDLATDILNISYNAHDAKEDVMALGKLIKLTLSMISASQLMAFSFTLRSVHNSQLFSEAKRRNIQSINVLVANGVCKITTAENIAGSGLNTSHLRKIFERDGEDGLRNSFVFKNSEGQPRVTNCGRVLDSVIPKLAEYFKNSDKA